MAILIAVLSKFIVEEIDAWSPTIIRRLIQLAVAQLPEDQRERYSEEWQSHVNEVPGRVGKLIAAADVLRAAHKMALTFRQTELVESWWEIIARREHSQAKLRMMLNEIQNDKAIASHEDMKSAVSRISSFLSQCEEHNDKLARSISQLSDNLPNIPTTPDTFIARLLIRYIMKNAVQKGFVEMSRHTEQTEGEFANLMRLADERKRQRTLTASPTKPMLNDVAEK